MAEKVKLSKDGNSIDFVQSENLPTSMKKFRQSPEIEGFYRFVFENDLQKESFEILDRISTARKAVKKAQKNEANLAKKSEQVAAKAEKKAAAAAAVQKKVAPAPAPKAVAKAAPVKPAAKAKAPALKVAAKPAVKPTVKAKAKPKKK